MASLRNAQYRFTGAAKRLTAAAWMAALLLAAPEAARAQQSPPALPAVTVPAATLVGVWPNVSAMSGMKNEYATGAGELQGDAQIGPAVGLPAISMGQNDAVILSGNGPGCLSVAGPVVDTSGSYTVSAWVKLNHVGGFQSVAGEDGQSASPFYLQYRDDVHSFVFATLPADASNDSPPAAQWNSGVKAAGFLMPQPNRWYWLVGVQDASAKTISLYIDGVLQQTLGYQGAWRAAGPLTIGRGFYNGKPDDYLDGEIADVQVFAGVHSDSLSELHEAAERAQRLDQQASVPAMVALDLAAPEKPSSPTLWGLMIEDINHSIDGGLYAELIQNRDFDFDPVKPVHWSDADLSTGYGAYTERYLAVDSSQAPPPGTTLRTSLRVSTNVGESDAVAPDATWGYQIENDGFWGIPIKPSTAYQASLYAKGDSRDYWMGSMHFRSGPNAPMQLYVKLGSADGKTVYAVSPPIQITTHWKHYTFVLQTKSGTKQDANGRFALCSKTLGTIWITHVSLMPPTFRDRPNGARIDLMKKLAGMKPAFLRLPGGNFLEGNTLKDWFDWKKTIGPTEDRPGHADPWGYPSTDGFGLLEYLEWCEDLQMEPVLAVYAGYSLSGDYVKPGADLAPYVQDAMDEIEYATGDAKTTKWGAARAADGHPAPFPLHYVEVGNEDWFDKSGSYEAGRFPQFFDAIRAKYPQLQIISTTGGVKSRRPDLIDEHYYLYPQSFIRDAGHYDDADRSAPKVFVGEWASQEGTPTPDMGACLGDAAWMCGLERNSDQVVLASYAPLLTHLLPPTESSNWGTNLIGFDGLSSYGSPSYFAQAMFAAAHGQSIVPLQINPDAALIGSATRTTPAADGSSLIYLKLVNPTDATVPAQIALQGLTAGETVASGAATRTLQGASPASTNTIGDPRAIAPVNGEIEDASASFTYPAPPYSVTVLTLRVSSGSDTQH